MEEWVTIAEFDNPTQGYLFKSLLESEGIVCYLKDENMTNLIPYSTGGIKLQVLFKDSFKALELYFQFKGDGDSTVL